jgi:hypothetical protein
VIILLYSNLGEKIMNRLKYILLSISAVFIFSACSNHMVKVPDNKIAKPTPDEATIVFMRSSFVLSAIGVEMFEVNDGKLTFIGNLSTDTRIAHKTKPGKKVYMAYGQAADFMIANVEAGKTYFSIVRPNWGTGGFAPTPIRVDGTSDYNTSLPAFKKWMNLTLYEIKQPEANEWFEKNKEKYEKIYIDYWNRFQRKTPNEKAQRTLNPFDAYELGN